MTDADVYEIVPAEPYASDDLDYNDKSSRSTKEQNDKSARPAIGSEKIELSGYKTIYIGFPIWWGEEPRIMDTFVESYDFSGEDDNTSDYISEALMKSVVRSSLIAIENPDDTMPENEECK